MLLACTLTPQQQLPRQFPQATQAAAASTGGVRGIQNVSYMLQNIGLREYGVQQDCLQALHCTVQRQVAFSAHVEHYIVVKLHYNLAAYHKSILSSLNIMQGVSSFARCAHSVYE